MIHQHITEFSQIDGVAAVVAQTTAGEQLSAGDITLRPFMRAALKTLDSTTEDRFKITHGKHTITVTRDANERVAVAILTGDTWAKSMARTMKRFAKRAAPPIPRAVAITPAPTPFA